MTLSSCYEMSIHLQPWKEVCRSIVIALHNGNQVFFRIKISSFVKQIRRLQ